MKNTSPRLTFYGGVETTTGSNFVLEFEDTTVMVDCGLIQGAGFCESQNYEPFAFDPKSIDAVFITHAHLDHIGRVPKLVREGFSHAIYSTPETKEIAELLFRDSIAIMAGEAKREGRDVLYTEADVEKALRLWNTIPYHEEVSVGKDVAVRFRDAGHILGSAMVEVMYEGTKILFSGDLGNKLTPLLQDAETVTDAHYMVIESVYGDRVHESIRERQEKLEDVVESTIREGGVLLIPAFSIERTQTLLYELNGLVERGRIPAIPVFLDSPLAIKVTEIYKKSGAQFNPGVKRQISGGDDIFNFPKLSFTATAAESKAIDDTPSPKIIIAGSGMSNGGRILHHEKRYLGDPSTTLLLVGFQAAGSLGRQLLDGVKKVTIEGEDVVMRAKIRTILAYSAHKDMDELLDFVEATSSSLKRVFVAMGETRSSLFFAQRLRDYIGANAVVPKLGESFTLE